MVNTDTTNFMIFNKAGRLSQDTFKYNDTNLQTVDNVIYLGIMIFVTSGIFSTAQRR